MSALKLESNKAPRKVVESGGAGDGGVPAMASLASPATPRKRAGVPIRSRILRVVVTTPQGKRHEWKIRPREGDWRVRFSRFLRGLRQEGCEIIKVEEVS